MFDHYPEPAERKHGRIPYEEWPKNRKYNTNSPDRVLSSSRKNGIEVSLIECDVYYVMPADVLVYAWTEQTRKRRVISPCIGGPLDGRWESEEAARANGYTSFNRSCGGRGRSGRPVTVVHVHSDKLAAPGRSKEE